MEELSNTIGVQAIMNMMISITLILLSWWALSILRFELFLRQTGDWQAKLLHVLLAVAIGHTAARFLIDYVQWTTWLRYFF
jgi:uncharacterized integral membrane protein (TIGR02327 family)